MDDGDEGIKCDPSSFPGDRRKNFQCPLLGVITQRIVHMEAILPTGINKLESKIDGMIERLSVIPILDERTKNSEKDRGYLWDAIKEVHGQNSETREMIVSLKVSQHSTNIEVHDIFEDIQKITQRIDEHNKTDMKIYGTLFVGLLGIIAFIAREVVEHVWK